MEGRFDGLSKLGQGNAGSCWSVDVLDFGGVPQLQLGLALLKSPKVPLNHAKVR